MFSQLDLPATGLAMLAQAEPQPANPLSFLIPMILIFVIMYMMLIRPQQKRNREHQEMIQRLKRGDKIVTAGGIHGTISQVGERTIMVKIADNLEIEVARASVGSIKSDEQAVGQDNN